jgi:hypothetical protein
LSSLPSLSQPWSCALKNADVAAAPLMKLSDPILLKSSEMSREPVIAAACSAPCSSRYLYLATRGASSITRLIAWSVCHHSFGDTMSSALTPPFLSSSSSRFAPFLSRA